MHRPVPSPDSSGPEPGDLRPRRVLLLGATGTVGGATLRSLIRRGYHVVCPVRGGSGSRRGPGGGSSAGHGLPLEAESRRARLSDPASVDQDLVRGERFDAVISCMASRTGVPRDAWAVDHRAHLNVLEAVREAGDPHFVLLSAICVQKPRLAFQQAKLAFEAALRDSGLTWSVVRATAFFKSLSGQAERVRSGKAFLVFGNGRLNACKPIGEEDLADFLVGCLDEPGRWNRILPIGGPGPALTPRDQGELLFAAAGRAPRFRSVPVGLLHAAVGVLGALGRVWPSARDKAELARIGRYYATESMLVWDPVAARYDADATPEFGSQTLAEYYRKLIRGEVRDERGDHALF